MKSPFYAISQEESGYIHLYPDELKTHLAAAGFRDITIKRDEARHWLAVKASK